MFPAFSMAVFAAVLIVYWLRYSCVLVLRRQVPRETVEEVSAANNLRLPDVRQRLESRPFRASELPALYRQLGRDYRMLAALVRYTAVFQAGGFTAEQRLMALDFRAMQAAFLACQVAAPRQARRALAEAVRVLEYFAAELAARAIAPAR